MISDTTRTDKMMQDADDNNVPAEERPLLALAHARKMELIIAEKDEYIESYAAAMTESIESLNEQLAAAKAQIAELEGKV